MQNFLILTHWRNFIPIQEGPFRGSSQMRGGGGVQKVLLLKICHTYPTMMKLGAVVPHLKKIQKYMNHVTQPLGSAVISMFSPEIIKFGYAKKKRYWLHFDTQFFIRFTVFDSLRIVSIKMVTISMMSAKMATQGPLKIKVFWDKSWNHDFSPRCHQQSFIT